MADNLTPITSDQLSKVTTAQDTDLVTLGINGNFVAMTLGDLKNVLGITELNTNKADVEDVTGKFNWGSSSFYKAVRIGKIVFFRARCTTKTATPMNFASIADTSLYPIRFHELEAYLVGGGDRGKHAEASVGLTQSNIITVTVYQNASSATVVAPTGDIDVYGWWVIA